MASCARDVPDEMERGGTGLLEVSSGERIHVTTAGHGPHPVLLLAGNSCSGRFFAPLLDLVHHREDVAGRFTFYALDYRGSGASTYHTPISGLEDFAQDFTDVVRGDTLLQQGGITLVGHSMGFGVAQIMVDLAPELYDRVISLAGIGTRGVRVMFLGSTVGEDETTGRAYMSGDWADSLQAIAFHQRGWSGDLRTATHVARMWNMVVFNDILAVNAYTGTASGREFLDEPRYSATLEDVLNTQYMPESLYACHRFNASGTTLTHTNQDGTEVAIPGEGRLTGFAGKPVLLVKATTDRLSWRGDLVIDDTITQNTMYDLGQAGASVTTVMMPAGAGYDHGFPVAHPELTLDLLIAFAQDHAISVARLDSLFGADGYTRYSPENTDWAREAYGGF